MSYSAKFLSHAEAAKQLGISAKALRLYEERGLVVPVRTTAGWRTYGPTDMARAAEIAALRALGLSLTQVAGVLSRDPASLDRVLAARQVALEAEARRIADTIAKVHDIRAGIALGRAPTSEDLNRMVRPNREITIAFDLPWPWGGERFELRDVRALNYIVGPLGSGKTRLAHTIAETLPDAAFLGLERAKDNAAAAQARLEGDPNLKARVDEALTWLVEEGAGASPPLLALLVALEADAPAALVVDMIEHGLDPASQAALVAYLRRRGSRARPLFLLTRSSTILDLADIGAHETIILCPANHSPPTQVAPYPGSPGYEAVATCLASPEVRARTEGVIAWRPQVA